MSNRGSHRGAQGVGRNAAGGTARPTLALDELPSGADAVVAGIGGGRGLAARLAALGLTSGSQIKVLQNLGRGPILLLVRDTRIALGRGEAARVTVSKVTP